MVVSTSIRKVAFQRSKKKWNEQMFSFITKDKIESEYAEIKYQKEIHEILKKQRLQYIFPDKTMVRLDEHSSWESS